MPKGYNEPGWGDIINVARKVRAIVDNYKALLVPIETSKSNFCNSHLA
jgi:hypothetical protein